MGPLFYLKGEQTHANQTRISSENCSGNRCVHYANIHRLRSDTGISGSLPVSGVVSETTAQSGQETAGVSESGSFTIHFIDVGQADSALVTCDGHSMLIDGGNADDSNLVYSVLQRETDGHLDYVVGTHAHEDHIGGLSGAFEADTADVTFCPVTEYDSKAFRNFKARADERGGGITVPAVGIHSP